MLFHSVCSRVDGLSFNLFCPLPFMVLLNKSEIGRYQFIDMIRGRVNLCLSILKVQDVLIFWGVQYIGAHNSGEAIVLITFLSYLFVFLFWP